MQKHLGIQGLRGLSILLVFLSHWYAAALSASFLPEGWQHAGAWVLGYGKYGVEIFFMISGYLITESLVRHKDVVSFATDRIARIYPVFLALHILVFFVGSAIQYKFFSGVGTAEWIWLFFSNLLLLPGIVDLPIAQIVAWTLSYEALFYVMAALAYVFCSRRVHLVWWIAWAVVAIALVWLHPRALYFAPGVLVFYLGRRGLLDRLSRIGTPALVGFLILWGIIDPADGRNIQDAIGRDAWSWACFGTALVLGTLFFAHVVVKRDSLITKFLASSAMSKLGEISYSFYLIHTFVMFPLKPVAATTIAPAIGPALTFILFGVLSLTLSIAISTISWALLEARFGRFLKGYLRACFGRKSVALHPGKEQFGN